MSHFKLEFRGGTEPDVRIVLANAMYTAAADDIEPTAIANSTVSWGQTGPDIYDETFNTLFFDGSQFEPGKKYIFNGELDSEGKVKDRIIINGYGELDNIDIVINNAQFTTPGHVLGNIKLTFDMPCYNSVVHEGITYPYFPKPPLDKVPVLEAGGISTETVIVAPLGSKKRLAGGHPVDIN